VWQLVQSLRTVFQPYLSFFRLDNLWDFFAPNVGHGSDFRYVIEDAAGKRHAFVPSADLNWYHPRHLWFRAWYLAIMENPDRNGDLAVEFFCRKHADLHPVSITLQEYQEGDFTPEDHLSGKDRMDLEFVTVNTLKRAKCPDSQP